MSTSVKRACDACHRRKVKCDGINPCRNCSASQLSCTYNAVPQKKGPKGSRAKVISELRESQRQTSLSAKVQNRINGLGSPQSGPAASITSGLVTGELVRDCVQFFFAHIYPTLPILQRERLDHQTFFLDQNVDTYCMLTSLCAFVLLQPGMALPGTDPFALDSFVGTNIVSATLLVEEVLRVRAHYDYLAAPSLNTICTGYFLFAYHHGLASHDKAWFYLREATSLVHMVGMHKEEFYMAYDGVEASRRRRLYWLLFATERAYALQHRRPLTLSATVRPPSAADDLTDPQGHLLDDFYLVANLFRPFDDGLITLWTAAVDGCAPDLASLRKRVGLAFDHQSPAGPTDQQPHQQWLKNMKWQLDAASSCVANNGRSDPSVSFPFSLSDAVNLISQVSPANEGALGVGLIANLLDTTSALMDVLVQRPASRHPSVTGPREHLRLLGQIVSCLCNGDLGLLHLLLSKVHEILPRLIDPMLQHAPENAALANIDIFDGLGNFGLSQQSCFPSSGYEKFGLAPPQQPPPQQQQQPQPVDSSGMDLASSSGGSKHATPLDTSSPFVSSPATMVSPGCMDMSQSTPGLPGDFNPMTELFSPVGAAPGPLSPTSSIPMHAPVHVGASANQSHGHHPLGPSASAFHGLDQMMHNEQRANGISQATGLASNSVHPGQASNMTSSNLTRYMSMGPRMGHGPSQGLVRSSSIHGIRMGEPVVQQQQQQQPLQQQHQQQQQQQQSQEHPHQPHHHSPGESVHNFGPGSNGMHAAMMGGNPHMLPTCSSDLLALRSLGLSANGPMIKTEGLGHQAYPMR